MFLEGRGTRRKEFKSKGILGFSSNFISFLKLSQSNSRGRGGDSAAHRELLRHKMSKAKSTKSNSVNKDTQSFI